MLICFEVSDIMTLRDIFGAQVLNPFRIARLIPHIPSFLRLFYGLFKDRRVPTLTKLVPLLAVLWLLSPLGIELDVLPVIGEVDAVLVIYFALKLFIWLCPPEVVREHVIRVGHPVQATSH